MFKHCEGALPKEIHAVDGFHGIEVECGTTPCVFEMIAFQYQGTEKEKESG